MRVEVGEIKHEAIRVHVEDYNGNDWEDHRIHIWDGEGFYGIGGVFLNRPVLALSPGEALTLIALLAAAVDET